MWVAVLMLGLVAFIAIAFIVMRNENEPVRMDNATNSAILPPEQESAKPVIVNQKPVDVDEAEEEREEENAEGRTVETYTDEQTGVSIQHPSDWSPEFSEGQEQWFSLNVTHISEFPDISQEEFVGLGSGWGQTQDTFQAEADMIATQNVVAPPGEEFEVPVVEFDNGLRAKAWLDGYEGASLVRTYTIYVGEYRITVSTVLDALLEEEEVTKGDVVEEHELKRRAPRSMKEHLEEFDRMMETLEVSAIQP